MSKGRGEEQAQSTGSTSYAVNTTVCVSLTEVYLIMRARQSYGSGVLNLSPIGCVLSVDRHRL